MTTFPLADILVILLEENTNYKCDDLCKDIVRDKEKPALIFI